MQDEHSRLDFEHYKNCIDCAGDHQDFLDDLRADQQLDEAIERENAEQENVWEL